MDRQTIVSAILSVIFLSSLGLFSSQKIIFLSLFMGFILLFVVLWMLPNASTRIFMVLGLTNLSFWISVLIWHLRLKSGHVYLGVEGHDVFVVIFPVWLSFFLLSTVFYCFCGVRELFRKSFLVGFKVIVLTLIQAIFTTTFLWQTANGS